MADKLKLVGVLSLVVGLCTFLVSWNFWFDSLSEAEFQQGEVIIQEIIEERRSIRDIPQNFSVEQSENVVTLKSSNEFTVGEINGYVFSKRVERDTEEAKRMISNLTVAIGVAIIVGFICLIGLACIA